MDASFPCTLGGGFKTSRAGVCNFDFYIFVSWENLRGSHVGYLVIWTDGDGHVRKGTSLSLTRPGRAVISKNFYLAMDQKEERGEK